MGVLKEFPVVSKVPPIESLYQYTIPLLAVAPKVTEPDPHKDAGVTAVMVGDGLIVAFAGVLKLLVHPLAVAST